MIIVKPSVELVNPPSYETTLNTVELAIRNCYQSYDKMKEGSAEGLIRGCISRQHCYDGNTEILTEVGFIPFKHYSGQKVATVNLDGTFKGFESPQQVIHYLYDGNIYDYSRTLGVKVTDHHKMFGVIYNTNKDSHNFNYKLFDVGEILYNKNDFYSKTNGQRKFWSPQSCKCDLPLLPYWELVGFWIGDGVRNSTTANKLSFHLRKKKKIEYIKQLCEKLGFMFEEMKGDIYNICSEGIATVFNHEYVRGGEKFLPLTIVDPQQIKSIIYGLINADGSVDTKNGKLRIATTSTYIKDWLINRGVLANYPLYVGYVIETKSNNHKPCYVIFCSANNRYLVNDSRKSASFVDIYEVSNFKVYCVSVSTGLIIVRGENSKIPFLCGNCSPLEFGDIAVKLVGDRNLMGQITRHRLASFCIESGRYNAYDKDKYGSNVKFIVPEGLSDEAYETWRASMLASEAAYFVLRKDHNMPAEVARSVLPSSLATTIYMKANIREWRHIFDLRVSKHAQSDIRKLMTELLIKMYEKYPVFFEDLYEKYCSGTRET